MLEMKPSNREEIDTKNNINVNKNEPQNENTKLKNQGKIEKDYKACHISSEQKIILKESSSYEKRKLTHRKILVRETDGGPVEKIFGTPGDKHGKTAKKEELLDFFRGCNRIKKGNCC